MQEGGEGREGGRRLFRLVQRPPPQKKTLRRLKGLSPRMKEQSHLAVVEDTLSGGLPARWEGNLENAAPRSHLSLVGCLE